MSENLDPKAKADFYTLLAKHNAKPSSGGENWAENNWFNLENIIDRICSLQHESKFKMGKNKSILCSVLGACLTAAIENRCKRRTEEMVIIDSLQNLVEILQKKLNEDRNEIYKLRAALREEHTKTIHKINSSTEEEEKVTPSIKKIYPYKEIEAAKQNYSYKESETVKNCGENCCPHLRPFIKTEYSYINDEDMDPHITTKQTPFSATELAKLKKEFGRLPHESETEYVFRVSLTGGDQIKLTEQEASGYWGHGVFLTTGDKRDAWSLTQRAAYWAGGINPLERGDPLAIATTPDQILESVQKAACLQMIHEKKLIPGFESPMQLPVKPEIMTPLIRGLPETLKSTAITIQKTVMALSPIDRLERFLNNSTDQSESTDTAPSPYTPTQTPTTPSDTSSSSRKIWTWSEVAVDLINYCRQYGPVKTLEEKSEKAKGVRFMGTPNTENTEPGKQISNRQRWWMLGIKKGVPRDIMDGLPLEKLQKIITNWNFRKTNTQPSAPILLPHQKLTNAPTNTQFSTHNTSQSFTQNTGNEPKLTLPQFLPRNLGSEAASQPLPQNTASDPKLTLSQFLSQNLDSETLAACLLKSTSSKPEVTLSQLLSQNLSNITAHPPVPQNTNSESSPTELSGN
ncbi:uncharacterized protein LOC141726918 [Zonotrichia albicollis]|uniref:uncharacterized protein LOC141726918 n=1 Tax=Zonotrichia albicollis TaxID=44394 RepID=UPI003D80E9A8